MYSVDESLLNTWGGSVSIGHPFGATGVRLLSHAANRHAPDTTADTVNMMAVYICLLLNDFYAFLKRRLLWLLFKAQYLARKVAQSEYCTLTESKDMVF